MNDLHEQVACYGPQTLSDEELLAIILHTGPHSHKSSSRIATMLAQRGGLSSLLRAEFGELCEQYHLSPTVCARLQALLEIAKRLASRPAETKYQITSADDAARLLLPEMTHLDHEEMRVLVLDTKNQVMVNQSLYQGTINSCTVRVAEIFRPAITRKGASILLCHNHPSGSTEPSSEDKEVTLQCVEAGKLLDINVLDHLIIGDQRYLSLRELMRW